MTYSEENIVLNADSYEVNFKVETHINDVPEEPYHENYVFTCDASNGKVQIQLKGEEGYDLKNQHPEFQEQLSQYANSLCQVYRRE